MFPYLVVYPGFGKGDYTVGAGKLKVMDRETLDQAVQRRLRTSPGEYIQSDAAGVLGDASQTYNTGLNRRIAEKSNRH